MPDTPSPVILAYPGALHSAVLGLSDILTFAGMTPNIVSEPGQKPQAASAIILPPAQSSPDPTSTPWIVDWLKTSAEKGVLICTACVGVTWVAAAGIDAGRPVTTHWGAGPDIKRKWPKLNLDTDRLIIEYSDLVSAGGLMAWIDLALIVIERHLGHQAMLATARHFVVDPGRRDQRRFQRFQPDMDHGDSKILRAQQLIETGIARQLRVTELAGVIGLSPRSFQRNFKAVTGFSFSDYVQKLRIEQAKTLLADTRRSVAEVASDVGYSDVPGFHRVFLKITGLPPSAFRKSVNG